MLKDSHKKTSKQSTAQMNEWSTNIANAKCDKHVNPIKKPQATHTNQINKLANDKYKCISHLNGFHVFIAFA